MLLDKLGKGLVELTKGMAYSMQFLPHHSCDVLQSLLHLPLRYFVPGPPTAVGGSGLVAGDAGRGLFEGRLLLPVVSLKEVDVDMQVPQYLLKEVLPEDHSHVLTLRFLLIDGGLWVREGILAAAGSNSLFLRALMQEMHSMSSTSLSLSRSVSAAACLSLLGNFTRSSSSTMSSRYF